LTGEDEGCYAQVCFRKTVTTKVESAALVWNGVVLFRQFGRWSFSLRYVLVAYKKKLKFYSFVVAIHIFNFTFISRSTKIPCFRIDKRKQTAPPFFVLIILFK
jgi:hypothetical protein